MFCGQQTATLVCAAARFSGLQDNRVLSVAVGSAEASKRRTTDSVHCDTLTLPIGQQERKLMISKICLLTQWVALAMPAAPVYADSNVAASLGAGESWTVSGLNYSGPGMFHVLSDGTMVVITGLSSTPTGVVPAAVLEPAAYAMQSAAPGVVRVPGEPWQLQPPGDNLLFATARSVFKDVEPRHTVIEINGFLEITTESGAMLVRASQDGIVEFEQSFSLNDSTANSQNDGEIPMLTIPMMNGCAVTCPGGQTCVATGRFAICFCGFMGPVCISSLIP